MGRAKHYKLGDRSGRCSDLKKEHRAMVEGAKLSIGIHKAAIKQARLDVHSNRNIMSKAGCMKATKRYIKESAAVKIQGALRGLYARRTAAIAAAPSGMKKKVAVAASSVRRSGRHK